MCSDASIIKEIEFANFLIDTFVIAPLNDELRCNKGENIPHFSILPLFRSPFSSQSESTINPQKHSANLLLTAFS